MTNRRRALMASQENDILYILKNHIISENGEEIFTGITPFAPNRNATIILDITTTSNPTSNGANASTAKYMLHYNPNSWEFGIVKASRNNSELHAIWMNTWPNYVSLTGSSTAPGRKRFVVTHEANSNNIIIYSKMDNGSVNTQTLSGEFVPITSTHRLWLGLSGANGLPKGTITIAAIYNRIWSNSERATFFA